jgi:hypothetical protein
VDYQHTNISAVPANGESVSAAARIRSVTSVSFSWPEHASVST